MDFPILQKNFSRVFVHTLYLMALKNKIEWMRKDKKI